MIIGNQECIQGVGAKGASDFEGQGLNGTAIKKISFVCGFPKVCYFFALMSASVCLQGDVQEATMRVAEQPEILERKS